MLSSLHIRNYVLIDSLDITFPEGLVIITGQTGAGKSILLGALSLLSGAKADATSIRDGADSCVVEAEFDYDSKEIDALLRQEDVETDSGHVIIRRTLSSSGRSRCFVNDSPVGIQTLSELSSMLLDIHSQHQSLLLTDHRFQLSILDNFAQNAGLLEKCSDKWSELQKKTKEMQELSDRLERLSGDESYNRAQWEQLDSAALKEGELEELEQEQKMLSSAEELGELIAGSSAIFNGREDSDGISSMLKEAGKLMAKAGKLMPKAEQLSQRIESERIELDDIAAELEQMYSGIDLSADRLEKVENRLSLLYSLMKKHDCGTVSQLIQIRDRFRAEVFDCTDLEDKLSDLRKEVARLDGEHIEITQKLKEKRIGAAPEFGAKVMELLHFLEMDRGVFTVDLQDATRGAWGSDSVMFKFSASGVNPVDVAKCASGGEISRIMLCLKAIMAKFKGMPTLIFDEIDTGVSGSVADKMGRMICDMGQDMQVFSITHLPQVAAKGKAHYLVTKQITQNGAQSTISALQGNDRIMEIARLLSGETITPEAIANAKSLLS